MTYANLLISRLFSCQKRQEISLDRIIRLTSSCKFSFKVSKLGGKMDPKKYSFTAPLRMRKEIFFPLLIICFHLALQSMYVYVAICICKR